MRELTWSRDHASAITSSGSRCSASAAGQRAMWGQIRSLPRWRQRPLLAATRRSDRVRRQASPTHRRVDRASLLAKVDRGRRRRAPSERASIQAGLRCTTASSYRRCSRGSRPGPPPSGAEWVRSARVHRPLLGRGLPTANRPAVLRQDLMHVDKDLGLPHPQPADAASTSGNSREYLRRITRVARGVRTRAVFAPARATRSIRPARRAPDAAARDVVAIAPAAPVSVAAACAALERARRAVG